MQATLIMMPGIPQERSNMHPRRNRRSCLEVVESFFPAQGPPPFLSQGLQMIGRNIQDITQEHREFNE
jgi:hypothetical protein